MCGASEVCDGMKVLLGYFCCSGEGFDGGFFADEVFFCAAGVGGDGGEASEAGEGFGDGFAFGFYEDAAGEGGDVHVFSFGLFVAEEVCVFAWLGYHDGFDDFVIVHLVFAVAGDEFVGRDASSCLLAA